jgi:TonB family protein
MSVTASMALHVGGLLFVLQAARMGSKAPEIKIDNVDLLIQTRKVPIPAVPHAAAPKPTSMMDLMKMSMALPAIPKIAAPQPVEIKLPEIPHPVLPTTPKLEDRRMTQLAKLDAIDLTKHRVSAASLDTKLEESHHVSALAALPRLEDVGVHRVKNLPQAIALEERRQEAVALQAIQSAGVPAERHSVGPAALLQEASPPPSSGLGRTMPSFLPTGPGPLGLQQAAPQAVAPIKHIETAPPAPPRHTVTAPIEKKKSVSIEGPLADRKVVSYDVPKFPDWAAKQGIMDADVVILFYVDPDGNVLPDMSVDHTSGSGQLDRLAMASLRNWKFSPIGTSEKQWGRITFHFVLE